MNTESANKFISALVKSLQTLCHGYVEFEDGIEIIGHLYLNIDSGSTFDYVVKEKVCKNAQNSTVFISKSFHAEGKPENTLITDDKGVITHGVEAAGMDDGTMSPSGTTRLQSAITNISNVLSGTQSQATSHSSSLQNTGKRKREHNGHYGSQLPYKYTTLQSSSSAMPYFSNSAKQQHSSRDGSKQFSNSQAEFFGGDSNASSGMGHDDEEDIDLDVTFVKEEYGDRNRGASAPARINQDTSANQQNLMHENNSGASYPLGYHHQQSQQFAGSGGGDVGTMNQAFHDPTQVDIGHHIPPPPNPRSNNTSTTSSTTVPPTGGGNSHTFQAPVVPTKQYRCPVCGIIIRHKNNIKRHMRRHNDPAVAGSIVGGGSGGGVEGGGTPPMHKLWSQHYNTASAASASPASLQVGKVIRNYSCPICGLSITHRKNVRRHMRKHTGEMFFCDLCEWRGTCRWKLQKHREKKHGIPLVIP